MQINFYFLFILFFILFSSFCHQIVQGFLYFCQVVKKYIELFSFHFEFNSLNWGFVVFLQGEGHFDYRGTWFSLFITYLCCQVPVHVVDIQVFALSDSIRLNFLNLISKRKQNSHHQFFQLLFQSLGKDIVEPFFFKVDISGYLEEICYG